MHFNILINVLTRLWGLLSITLFTPLFVKILGVEGFGLISFYNTLSAVLIMLDLGIATAITRVVLVEGLANSSVRSVVRTAERTMMGSALIAIIIVSINSGWFVTQWINVSDRLVGSVQHSLILMGVAIALQFFCSLYCNALMGLDHHLAANVGLLVQGLIKSVGSLAVLLLVSPDLIAFFAFQVLANGATIAYYRLKLMQIMPKGEAKFDTSILGRNAKYSIGLFTLGIISTFSLQIDKIMVSKIVPLDLFGFFSLAALIASLPVLVVGTIGGAVFPRFVARYVAGESEIAVREYAAVSQFAASVASAIAFTIVFYPFAWFQIWASLSAPPDGIVQTIALLAVAQLVQSLTLIPYQFALSHGKIRLNVLIGIATFSLHFVILSLLLPSLGVVAAGVSWLVVSVVTVLPYMYLLHRKVHAPFSLWWGKMVPPVGSALIVTVFLSMLVSKIRLENSIVLITFNIVFTFVVAVLMSQDLTREIKQFGREKFRCI